MSTWRDPFPGTPEGFHRRVEQTLGGLEDKDMKHLKYKKLMIVAVAALVAALAATAVAAVIGHSRLKDELEREGLTEVADMVQQVHLGGEEAEGFAFTIDELIWEDDNLFLTYSVRVPDDGNYLVALHMPWLNDRPLAYDYRGFNVARFYEDGRTVLVFNDEYGRSCTDLLTFTVDPALKDRGDNALEFKAELYSTDLRFEAETDLSIFLDPPHVASLNPENTGFDDVDSTEFKVMPDLDAATEESGALTLDALVDSGRARRVDEREIILALDAAALPQTVYNDVEAHDFDVDGVHLHVDSFRMTHMGIRIEYTLSVPGYHGEDENAIRRLNHFDDVNRGFGTIDGKPLYTVWLGGNGEGGWAPLQDGTPAYSFSYEYTAMIPLEGIQQIVYAPMTWPEDADGNQLSPVYDLDHAVVLTPIYNPAIAGAEARESAEREAIAAQYEGSRDELVYATENGIWYHTFQNCSGMRNARPMTVGEAVAAGKRPCPRCAEGDPNDISEPDGNESCFSE